MTHKQSRRLRILQNRCRRYNKWMMKKNLPFLLMPYKLSPVTKVDCNQKNAPSILIQSRYTLNNISQSSVYAHFREIHNTKIKK